MKKLFFVFSLLLLAVAAVRGEDGEIPRALPLPLFDLLCIFGCTCFVPDASILLFLVSGCMDRSPSSCSSPPFSALLRWHLLVCTLYACFLLAIFGEHSQCESAIETS
jgi:hypothetical protein